MVFANRKEIVSCDFTALIDLRDGSDLAPIPAADDTALSFHEFGWRTLVHLPHSNLRILISLGARIAIWASP